MDWVTVAHLMPNNVVDIVLNQDFDNAIIRVVADSETEAEVLYSLVMNRLVLNGNRVRRVLALAEESLQDI